MKEHGTASDGSTCKRLECQFEETCVAELKEKLLLDWEMILNHINIKRIQSTEFEKDTNEPNVTHVPQIDFVINYFCEYQNEVQSALWSRSCVLSFTAATVVNGDCQ